jgi:hypothetical protein
MVFEMDRKARAVVVASVFSGIVGFVRTAKKPAAPVVSDRGRGFEGQASCQAMRRRSENRPVGGPLLLNRRMITLLVMSAS